MIWLKLLVLKVAATVATLIAAADVGTYSMVFFYQPEIPAQLKK